MPELLTIALLIVVVVILFYFLGYHSPRHQICRHAPSAGCKCAYKENFSADWNRTTKDASDDFRRAIAHAEGGRMENLEAGPLDTATGAPSGINAIPTTSSDFQDLIKNAALGSDVINRHKAFLRDGDREGNLMNKTGRTFMVDSHASYDPTRWNGLYRPQAVPKSSTRDQVADVDDRLYTKKQSLRIETNNQSDQDDPN